MLKRHGIIAASLVLAGIAAVLYAVLSDAWLGGKDGVGPRQWALTIGGALLLVTGLYASPTCRPRLARFVANDPPVSFGESVWLAIWFGVLTGLFEVGHQVVRTVGFGELFTQPLHIVWMAPLSFVLIFVALAVILGVLRVFVPAIKLRVLVFCIALFAVWGQVIIHNTIDSGAGIVLSAGFAGYLARICGSNAERLHRLRQRTLPWLVTAIAVAGVSIPIWSRMEERGVIDALPAARAGDPNVLFIVLDTVRADHLGVYGYHRDTTPRMSKLAESSIVFDWPIAPCSWTLPSHATFFTGRYPFEHRSDWLVPLDDTYPTLAELLSERGYATGGFVGNLAFCLREHGVARGFQRYEDFFVDRMVTTFSTALGSYLHLQGGFRERVCAPCHGVRNDAPRVTQRFLHWLDEIEDDGRPFFGFLNYFDAHHLYWPPPPYDTMFDADGKYQDEKAQRFVNAYDGLIAQIDAHVGMIVDSLRERGLLDNTWIIITGDHGELFGEHGLQGHGNSLYRPLLHCPLVVRPPGGTTARRFEDIVSLRDLPATILDVTGHDSSSPIPGHSLAPFWRGSGSTADIPRSPAIAEIKAGINLNPSLPVSKGRMKSLTADGMHYIRNGDGTEELYELVGDPLKEENLIETPEGAAAAAKMRAVVDQVIVR